MRRVRDALTVVRLVRVLVSVVLLVLVLLVRAGVVAHADTHDPYVPPGMVTTEGHDVSGLVVGGRVPPAAAATSVQRASWQLSWCAMVLDSVSWSAGSATVLFHGAHTSDGSGWCSPPTSVQPPEPYGYCSDGAGGVVLANPAFIVGAWVGGGISYSRGCGAQGDEAPVAVGWTYVADGAWTSHDGWLSWDPGVALSGSVHVACSDGSSFDVAVSAGSELTTDGCPSGSFMLSATVTNAAGSTVGTVSTHPDFPPECAAGTCVPWVLSNGSMCPITAAGCSWWAGVDVATSCGWGSQSEMWVSLPASDCEDARSHAGFPDPGWSEPLPTHTPSSSSSAAPGVTVTVNVNVTVKPQVNVTVVPTAEDNPEGGCLAQHVSINPTSWVLEPIKCLFVPQQEHFTGIADYLCVIKEHEGELYKPCDVAGNTAWGNATSEWYAWLKNMVAAFATGNKAACEGPALKLPMIVGTGQLSPDGQVVYPLQACTDPGMTLAATLNIGLRAVILVAAFRGCFKVVASMLRVVIND